MAWRQGLVESPAEETEARMPTTGRVPGGGRFYHERSSVVTVREALNLALPEKTRVLAGAAGLARDVAWARVIRAQPPVFEGLEAGDMVLLTPDLLEAVAELLSPSMLIAELAELEVAAIALLGELPTDAGAAADEHALPLLALPAGASLREVEKAVIRLVLNHRAEIEARGVQMYRQLAQCITAGQGIDDILGTLAQITGKTVVLQDHAFRLRSSAGPANFVTVEEQLDGLLALVDWEGGWPQGEALVSTAPPIAKFSLSERGLGRYSAPIIVYDCIVGYVSILGPEADLNELDRVAVGRAASVCAIEMTKERAVVEAENRTRGEFIDSLLSDGPANEEALAERATTLGYDLSHSAVALVFGLDRPLDAAGNTVPRAASGGERALIGVVREETNARGTRGLLKGRDSSVVVLLPLREKDLTEPGAEPQNGRASSDRLRKRVEEVRQQAMRRLNEPVSVGIGRPSRGVAGIRASFQEAEQALSIAQRLFGGNRTVSFDELRVYGLLFPLHSSGELRRFHDEILGKLVEYDAKHSGELVRTLETFFACDGNLQRTADTLYLHRNTLAYRLERIEDISNLSLRDQDDRLCLQLALKIKDIT
jgi:PucR family transcriptional regulator, purine catabolism regulatory protein